MLLPALVKVRWGGPAVATRARPLFQMPQEGCAAIEAWVARGTWLEGGPRRLPAWTEGVRGWVLPTVTLKERDATGERAL